MHDHLSVLCWEDVINLTTESVCAHIGVCARVCLCARILHLWFKLQNRRDICGCVCTDVSGSCFLQLHYPRRSVAGQKKKRRVMLICPSFVLMMPRPIIVLRCSRAFWPS